MEELDQETAQDFRALADYNGEVARGILHKAEYDARMAEVQKRYDRWLAKKTEASGGILR
jgi:hypothetical protein